MRRFVEKTAPLLNLRIEGDPEDTFTLAPTHVGSLDPLLTAFEMYPETVRNRLTVYKPEDRHDAVWLHPGEPVFDSLSESVIDRFADEGLRGAVFIDPYSEEPYLFHIALVSVERGPGQVNMGPDAGTRATLLDSRLVGLLQRADGGIEECPVEHLLLLRGEGEIAPGQIPLAALARNLVAEADGFLRTDVIEGLVTAQRQRILDDLPSRLEFVNRGFDFQAAELAARRNHFTRQARSGDSYAKGEDLSKIRARQRSLTSERNRSLAELKSEPDRVQAGEVKFLVHALAVPSQDSEDVERFDTEVESIAMKVAAAYEDRFGADVKDVSRPELACRAGLPDWPGFDLLSFHLDGQRRNIEVKGRARSGSVEISDNEWSAACNHRDDYWLYVVYDCATTQPRLVRVRDPFGKLLANSRDSRTYTVNEGAIIEAAE